MTLAIRRTNLSRACVVALPFAIAIGAASIAHAEPDVPVPPIDSAAPAAPSANPSAPIDSAAPAAPAAPSATPSAPPTANAATANAPWQPRGVYAPFAPEPGIPSTFSPPPVEPETEMRSPALLGAGIGVATLGAALGIAGGALLGNGEQTGWPGVFMLIPGGVLVAAGVPMIAVGASAEEVEPTPGSSRWQIVRGTEPGSSDVTEMRAPGMTAVGTTLIALGGTSAIAISAKAIVEMSDDGGGIASEVWGLNGASFAAVAGGIAMTVHGARQDPVGVEVMRSQTAVDAGLVLVTTGAMLTSSMTFGLVADALRERHANEPGVFWGTPTALAGGVVLMGAGVPLVIWGSGDPPSDSGERPRDAVAPPEVRVGPSGFDVKWRF